MPLPEGRQVYEFGDFRLDADQRLLLLKDDGRALPLVSRAFDVLHYLVGHAGELVSKADLMTAVWPDTIVEENNLSQSIAAIRRVLGERPGEHKYIVTIPGRGFRFVAPVSTLAMGASPEPVATVAATAATAPALPRPADRRWIFGVLAAAAAVIAVAVYMMWPHQGQTGTHALAILPFKPIDPADDNLSLRYGMADTLISRLRELEGVAVQPFSSVRRYGDPEQDAVEAARKLGVASVLDGTIQRHGERLRVSARLVDVASGQQLWSEQFHEDFTDIFAVQDAIAAKVTEALAMRLSGRDDRRLKRRYTNDAEAYQLYVNGWFQRSRTDAEGYLRSIDFFEQAIARDPNYPLPYVGLADSYSMLGVFGVRAPREVFPQALAAVTKALELDSELGEAHASLGHIKVQYERDLEGAASEYHLALRLVPDYAIVHMWYALYLAQTDRLPEALSRLRHAQELEPLQLGASANIGQIQYYSRDYDGAIVQLQKVLDVEPGMDHARSLLGRAYLRKGDYDRAIEEFQRRKSPSVGSYADLGSAYALAGRRQEALAELGRVIALSRERYVSSYDIAAIHASLGDADAAFASLEQAVSDRAQMLGLLYVDPSFDTLRSDPRMPALLRRLKAPVRVASAAR